MDFFREQNSCVSDPDSERPDDLGPVQRAADEEPGQQTEAEQSQTGDEEAAVGESEFVDGWEEEEEGIEFVGFELAFEHEIHAAGHAGQGEGSVGDDGKRRVKFEPGVRSCADQLGQSGVGIEGEKGDSLDQENDWGCKNTHQRKAIGRTDDHVDEGDRPAEEDEDLEEVGDGAAPDLLPAQVQENGLEQHPARDGDEVKFRRANELPPDRDQRPDEPEQVTDC